MRIRFAEAAHDDSNEAGEWFDQQQTGLRARFKREVCEAALLVAKAPLLFPVELKEV